MSINLVRFVSENKRVIYSLTKSEFTQKYSNNFLGVLWAVIQPLATILVLWFVFEVGFKASPINDVPFILWLITGLIPWFFLADTITSGTNTLLNHAFLVKKMVFDSKLLPIISILTSLTVHVFFIAFLVFVFSIKGYFFNIYNLQAIYYTFCCIALAYSISLFTASVSLFVRDIIQVVGVVIQFGFWLTPILWDTVQIPEMYLWVVDINPVSYIVLGYRDSFINFIPFWEHGMATVYFWVFTIATYCLGNFTFKKLTPHFADVI